MRADTARKSSLVAAVLSAVAASACCVGPLVFATLGIGGAGSLVAMEPYRPLFAMVTSSLLAVGFYVTYRPRDAQTDDCGCESPRASRTGRWLLWLATGAAAFALISPSLLANGLVSPAATGRANERPAQLASMTSVTLTVEGMTCGSCEGSIRKVVGRLKSVDSVEVSFEEASATVRYDPGQITASAVAEAITGLGYPATVQAPGSP
ncbi:MAG: mercuric ion transport protein [Cognaticolwellia sp.]|jgi:mercuric ion transport protein